MLVAAANAVARDILVPNAVALDPPDDVSLDDVADASPDVTHEAPDPVAFFVIADDNAVEATIDHNVEPTNTYNLRSRSAPTFGSYSNPNNVQLNQQTHPDLAPSSPDFSIDIDDNPSTEELNLLYQSLDQCHINLQSTEQPYLHHQAQANNRHLPTFNEV